MIRHSAAITSTSFARPRQIERRRVAVIHLVHEWVGGAEVVALATIEALKDQYEVTLVGLTRPDLQQMNTLFGLALSWSEFCWREVPFAEYLERLSPDPNGFLRLLHSLRFCRSLAPHFDLMISTFNDMDLGAPGIQYCHHPGMALVFQPGVTRSMMSRASRLPIYFVSQCWLHRAVAALTGYRESRARRNMTLANSAWTARVMERAYREPVEVVYPPVREIVARRTWQEKKDGCVCIGRLVRHKRIHDVLTIVGRVRQLGFDIHLHVVASSADPAYVDELAPALRAAAAWAHLEWQCSRSELDNLLSAHRYGLHAMENEHFGIAVAEMVKAGMIPFVHASGGPTEIVGDERLAYSSIDEAVAKFVAVLSRPELELEILETLEKQAAKFSRTRFASAVQSLVARRVDAKAARG